MSHKYFNGKPLRLTYLEQNATTEEGGVNMKVVEFHLYGLWYYLNEQRQIAKLNQESITFVSNKAQYMFNSSERSWFRGLAFFHFFISYNSKLKLPITFRWTQQNAIVSGFLTSLSASLIHMGHSVR